MLPDPGSDPCSIESRATQASVSSELAVKQVTRTADCSERECAAIIRFDGNAAWLAASPQQDLPGSTGQRARVSREATMKTKWK